MKILVTGGLGFIGSNFLNMYVNKYPEHDFYNIDSLTYASNFENVKDIKSKSNYYYIRVDISQEKQVEKIFDLVCPDCVIHFAAESHVDRSIKGPKIFIETNIIGTYNLLESARKHWTNNDHVFLHISTDEVYGELDNKGSFNELSRYSPNSPYSASKAASDHMVKAWHKTYGLPIKIINCSNNYGPRQFPEKFIPLMTINAMNGSLLPIYGKGDNIRDWIFVEDHCNAIWEVLINGKIGETYNVGGANEKTNIEVIEAIIKILVDDHGCNYIDLKKLIVYVADRLGHDFRYSVDISKIKSELQWVPHTTFETGLKKTINWYINNTKWINDIKSNKYNGPKMKTKYLKIYNG
jgi:dTDP-glucose 4,6-dehydratase